MYTPPLYFQSIASKLDYVKIPLLLNINVGQSNRVKLQLGLQLGSLLNQHVDNLNTDMNIFKKSDFFAVGGLCIQLPLVNIGGRYETGLNNINDIDNSEKWETRLLQFLWNHLINLSF